MFSACCKNGFFLTGSRTIKEDNGGIHLLKSAIGYGPLGATLRNNLINEWQYSTIGTSSANVHQIHFHSLSEGVGQEVESVINYVSRGSDQCRLKVPYGLAFCSNGNTPLDIKHDYLHLYYVSPFSIKQDWMLFWQRRKLNWWKKFSRCPEKFVLKENKKSTMSIEYNTNEGQDILVEDINTYQYNKDTIIHHFKTNIDTGLWSILTDSFLVNNRQWSEHQSLNGLLQLNRRLAPIKLVFLPQENSSDQQTFCEKLTRELNLVNITAICHEEGSLESRLAYHDEIGTPSRVLLDENTLSNGVLYLQDRDSGLSEPLESELLLYTLQKMYQRFKDADDFFAKTTRNRKPLFKIKH